MPEKQKQFDKRFIILTAVLAIALYVLLPQFGDFKNIRSMIRHSDTGWLGLSVLSMLLTYFAAAGTYYFLAYRKLKYGRTVLVELAAMFVNRLLPGGVGALGANFIYLKRNHSNPGQAGTIVALNNTLGFIGHGLLTVIIVLIYSSQISHLNGNENHTWSAYIKYALTIMLVVVMALIIFGQKYLKKFVADATRQLLSYKNHFWVVLAALTTSVILTICNVLCLYFCMHAVGQQLSVFAVFFVFSFAVGAGTATPTPGGLGGYEAALVAGFVAYGLDGTTALGIALLYRLISYWLALLLGGVTFVISQRLRYI